MNMNIDHLIADANDNFRMRQQGQGAFAMTPGVLSLNDDLKEQLLGAVLSYSKFADDETRHDFGIIKLTPEIRVYWKIDYFHDHSMTAASFDMLHAFRLITLLLPEEY